TENALRQAAFQIVSLLNSTTLNVNEIAARLGLPQSTVATSVKQLREAGIVTVETAPGSRGGMQKRCSLAYDALLIEFPSLQKEVDDRQIEIEMPVGLYADYEVSPTCGLCSTEKIIGMLDVPQTFSLPERAKASLLWFSSGYVEYKFPRNASPHRRIRRLELSLELCSEAPNSAREWPSDITVWINGREIGTWTSPGEFGEPRGMLTPQWWRTNSAQYGLLKHWSVSAEGTFIDGEKVSSLPITELGLDDHHSIRVCIGIKDNAVNRGGINIFGRGFGNYDQDLLLNLELE
ncbi:MAG: ArsR/SmtB family transcription factor, partial [Spirochaetia bacterium]